MNVEYARTIEEKIEIGLNTPKKTYSLTLLTPKIFLHSDRLQTSWISKLPFSINIQQNQNIVTFDTIIKLEKEEIYLISYIEDCVIYQNDGFGISLVLGLYHIDSKGNELVESIWTRCPKDLSTAIRTNNSISIESDGILYKFSNDGTGDRLDSVAYKIQVLPKGMPTMQVPRHLFGELGKTKPGIEKLTQTKYLEEYMQNLSENLPVIEKRAYLWALGHTGASNTGATYLAKIGAIEAMVKVAEKSSVLSLRGTASQALSLIARSSMGRAELNKYSWTSAEPQSASIAVPASAEAIFWIEKNADLFPYKDRCKEIDGIMDDFLLNDEEKEILKHICILGSAINKSESELFLRNLRSNSPMSYQSLPLFHAVMVVLGSYSFKLPTRRFIHKVFERINRIECFDDLDTFRYIS